MTTTSKGPTVPMTCAVCGCAFLAAAYQIRAGRGHFCSVACANQAKRGRHRPTDVPREERSCELCGQRFVVRVTQPNRFCSKRCAMRRNGLLHAAQTVGEHCTFYIHGRSGTREKRTEYVRTSRRKYLRAHGARQQVYLAVRDGRLQKGSQCEHCGSTTSLLTAHHEDYREPLVVQWLCRSCHSRLHRQLNAMGVVLSRDAHGGTQ